MSTPRAAGPRGIDHVVHVVRDLEAAGALYQRLGFRVGARNRHPFGTHNRIVQLAGSFVELLTVAEPGNIAAPQPRRYSFGAFNRDFLARQDGLSMLALESHSETGDADAFRASGIGDFEPFRFEREGRHPDGTPLRVVFTLSFATDPKAPHAGFFTCRHHHPENFWNPAFQDHPNTARTIAGVVLVAENPTDHHIFLEAFAGEREVLATSSGITVKTPRGDIQVMDPAAFRVHFDTTPPPVGEGARFAALRFGVRDLIATQAAMRASGTAARTHMGRLVVEPGIAMGATLAFEAVRND